MGIGDFISVVGTLVSLGGGGGIRGDRQKWKNLQQKQQKSKGL